MRKRSTGDFEGEKGGGRGKGKRRARKEARSRSRHRSRALARGHRHPRADSSLAGIVLEPPPVLPREQGRFEAAEAARRVMSTAVGISTVRQVVSDAVLRGQEAHLEFRGCPPPCRLLLLENEDLAQPLMARPAWQGPRVACASSTSEGGFRRQREGRRVFVYELDGC